MFGARIVVQTRQSAMVNQYCQMISGGDQLVHVEAVPRQVEEDFAMSLQAEDPAQVATPGADGVARTRLGGLVVEAGARARARNIDMALAVVCLLMLFASYFIEPVLVFDLEVPLALALALTLLVRTSRRQPVAVVDRALQWALSLSLPILWFVLAFSYAAGFILLAVVVVLALAVVVVTVVRRSQNPPFSMKLKRISAVHQADTGLTGGVLEVTDVNGVRVRIPAGRGMSPSTNGFAIVSLITALVGLGGILAVIFGHIARSQIRRTGERGWGMATAGLIIGYIGIVVGVAVAIVYFYELSRL